MKTSWLDLVKNVMRTAGVCGRCSEEIVFSGDLGQKWRRSQIIGNEGEAETGIDRS